MTYPAVARLFSWTQLNSRGNSAAEHDASCNLKLGEGRQQQQNIDRSSCVKIHPTRESGAVNPSHSRRSASLLVLAHEPCRRLENHDLVLVLDLQMCRSSRHSDKHSRSGLLQIGGWVSVARIWEGQAVVGLKRESVRSPHCDRKGQSVTWVRLLRGRCAPCNSCSSSRHRLLTRHCFRLDLVADTRSPNDPLHDLSSASKEVHNGRSRHTLMADVAFSARSARSRTARLASRLRGLASLRTVARPVSRCERTRESKLRKGGVVSEETLAHLPRTGSKCRSLLPHLLRYLACCSSVLASAPDQRRRQENRPK